MSENFEEKIKKAEEILNRLDKEDVALDESIKLHNEGKELLKQARLILENAKLSIEQVNE